MSERAFNFRDLFVSPGMGETVRAFSIFGVLLLGIVGIGGELASRDLSLNMLRQRFNLGQMAAVNLAQEVALLGREGNRITSARLWKNQERLRRLMETRIEESPIIRHLEIRDRFGVRLVFVGPEPPRLGRPPTPRGERVLPGGLPRLNERIIQVRLQPEGQRAAGEIRLGISQEALQQELLGLRRALWIKVAVAGVLALGILVLGLLYVLHLIRKNRNLEQARQSAARASYVGLLASGLAHEIRNPLNAMSMNLQMLEEELHEHPELLQEDSGEMLESTKMEIKRLERLVNNFLTYARPARPRLESKDLNLVVREVIRLLDADFRQSRVELAADLEPLLPDVETDEAQFKQALINLLVNARQVLEDGGRVTVRTRAGSKGEVVLEVSDDGPGIPEEARERIFEVFYSSRGGGTGLGLPIARQVIERHGGTIEVASVEGQGTTFRVRLPRHAQRPAEPAAAQARG